MVRILFNLPSAYTSVSVSVVGLAVTFLTDLEFSSVMDNNDQLLSNNCKDLCNQFKHFKHAGLVCGVPIGKLREGVNAIIGDNC